MIKNFKNISNLEKQKKIRKFMNDQLIFNSQSKNSHENYIKASLSNPKICGSVVMAKDSKITPMKKFDICQELKD